MSVRLAALLISIAALVSSCGTVGTDGVQLVAADSAAQVVEQSDVVVLDIRTPDEFASGSLPGAVNLDFYAEDFSQQLAQLDKDATYVMYCRSGNRSEVAAAEMRDLAFSDVYEIDGGILSWMQSGGTVVLP